MTTPASHHSVFLQAGCPSCRPTNSVKALKARVHSMLEKSFKILEFGIKTSRPLKVLENR